MTKLVYTPEQLLNLRAYAPKEKPAGIPEEISISKYGNIATLFNGRTGTSCRPVEKSRFEDNSDLGNSPLVCI
ncbi:TPA: hypothetical protein ACPSKE_002904 [Legionella feeleii]